MQRRVAAWLYCVAVLFGAVSLEAQTIVGQVSGTVRDSSGGVLPGAAVVVRNVGTGLTWQAVTSDAGFYVVTNLPVGTYAVKAELTGFRPAEKIGLTIGADARVTVDLALDPGGLEEVVSVQAVLGDTINRTSGELARTIDGAQVRELALNGRNYLQLLSLIPGAVQTSNDPIAQTTSLGSTGQTINGARPDTSNLMVDGGFNLDSGSNGSQINSVGVDFIEQVKIQTSNFSAEYGRSSGAAINVVTRSGTNQIGGSLFGFLRDDRFDKANHFTPLDSSGRAVKAPLDFSILGGAIGGPIRKNRAFFFAGIEHRRVDRADGPFRQTLPTTAELGGDFSRRLAGADGIAGTGDDGVLRDPLTGQPFAGNVIPADRLTADGRALAAAYRAMIDAATSFQNAPAGSNATYQLDFPFSARQDILRLDYRMSASQSAYLRYLHDENELVEPRGTFSGAALPTTPTRRVRPGTSYQLGHTWTLSPRLVSEAKLSVAWHSQRTYPDGEAWQRDTYGFQYPQLFAGGTYDDGIPNVSVAGFAGLTGPSFAAISPTTDIQFQNTVTMITGRHSIRAGAGVVRNRKDADARPPYTGALTFNASGNPRSTGNALADGLLGNFRTYTEGSDGPLILYRFTQYSAFVSDTWRVRPDLSLELGLRYESPSPTNTLGNNLTTFDPARYDPAMAVRVLPNGLLVPGSGFRFNGLVRAGDGIPSGEEGRVQIGPDPDFARIPTGAARSIYEPNHMWMPRVSAAYSLNERTVFRGGAGLFYDKPSVTNLVGSAQLPPFIQTVAFENGNLADPSGGQPTALAPLGAITVIDPGMKLPFQVNFSAGVQRELRGNLFVEAAYVGNRGRRLLWRPDINQPPFEALAANAALPAPVSVNALRPYAGYSAIQQLRSDATSNYNALQLYLTRRQGAVRFTVGYTLSKAMTDASGNTDAPEDPFDRTFNYGPASFDRRHVFVTTYTYEVPWLRGRRDILALVASGWEISGITRWQSGQYLTVTGNSSIGARRGDYVGGDIRLDDRSQDRWFNTAAFANAPDNRRGTATVGQIEGPHFFSTDLSLRKRWPLARRMRLGVQADIFNLFDRVNLGNPVTNAAAVGFGQISTAGPARQVQIGLRLEF